MKTAFYVPKITREVQSANYLALRKASAYIRRVAGNLIKVAAAGTPSDPGKPPKTRVTRKGDKLLKRAILFSVHPSGTEALIGPSAHMVGPVGAVHEHGDHNFRGGDYPARPFMGPALTRSRTKLAANWRNSVRSR